jgi:hypothetical protein
VYNYAAVNFGRVAAGSPFARMLWNVYDSRILNVFQKRTQKRTQADGGPTRLARGTSAPD